MNKCTKTVLATVAALSSVGCNISKPQALVNHQWDKYRPVCLAEGFEPVTQELHRCIARKIDENEVDVIGGLETTLNFGGLALEKAFEADVRAKQRVADSHGSDERETWSFSRHPELGEIEDGDSFYLDGTWYRRQGDRIYGDNGVSCSKIGVKLRCR